MKYSFYIFLPFFLLFFISSDAMEKQGELIASLEKKISMPRFNRVTNTYGTPSLKEIASNVFVEAQVVPLCERARGDTLDAMYAEVKSRLGVFTVELRAFVTQQLFYSCLKHGWNVACRKKRSDDKKHPYYVDLFALMDNKLRVRKRFQKYSQENYNYKWKYSLVTKVDRHNFSPSGQFLAVAYHDKTIVILKNNGDVWNSIKEETNGCASDYDNVIHHVSFLDEQTCLSYYYNTLTLLSCLPENEEIVIKKLKSYIKDVWFIDENQFFVSTYMGHLYSCKKSNSTWKFDLIEALSLDRDDSFIPSSDGLFCAAFRLKDISVDIFHNNENASWSCVKKVQNPNPSDSALNKFYLINFDDGMITLKRRTIYSPYNSVCYDLATDCIISQCKDDSQDFDLERHPSLEAILAFIALSNSRIDENLLSELKNSNLVTTLQDYREQIHAKIEKFKTRIVCKKCRPTVKEL